MAAPQERRAQLGGQGGRDAVDGRAGLGRRGDLGDQVVGAGGGHQRQGLGAAAEAGQGQGLVLGRAVGPGQLKQALGRRRVEAAGQLGVAQLDPPAVAEGPVQLAAGPLRQSRGLAVVAGQQGALGQGDLGVQARVGARVAAKQEVSSGRNSPAARQASMLRSSTLRASANWSACSSSRPR